MSNIVYAQVRIDQTQIIRDPYRKFNHESFITSVCFSSDNQNVFSAGGTHAFGNVRQWDIKTGELIHEYERFIAPVTSIDITNDGRFLAAASADNTIVIWNTDTKEKIHTLRGHTSIVDKVVFLNPLFYSEVNYNLAASCGASDLVIVWDVITGRLIQKINVSTGINITIDFDVSPDNRFIAKVEFSLSRVTLFDLAGNVFATFEPLISSLQSIAFHPFADFEFAVGDITGRIFRFNNDNHSSEEFQLHEDVINDVEYSPDGLWILTASDDTSVNIYDPYHGSINTFESHTGRVLAARFSPNQTMIVSGGLDMNVLIWQVPGTSIDNWDIY